MTVLNESHRTCEFDSFNEALLDVIFITKGYNF